MEYLSILTLFRVCVAWQNAIYNPIDHRRKSVVEKWQCPIADFFYRCIRLVGCILIMLWPAWLFLYGVGCYIIAWLFQQLIFYSYYELD